MSRTRLVIASSYAAIVTITFVTIITIWAELAAPLKDWLKIFSGHHWTSKSVLSVLVYAVAAAVLYKVFPEPNDGRLRQALFLLLWSAVLGVIALTVFYTGHHFEFFS